LALCADVAPRSVPLSVLRQHPDPLPGPLTRDNVDIAARELVDRSLARCDDDELAVHRLTATMARAHRLTGRTPGRTLRGLVRADCRDEAGA
jgi:hypothetical protein